MAQELQIVLDYYDFSCAILRRVLAFPRNLRYGLGLAIERRLETILTLLLEAKYAAKHAKLCG